MSAVTTIHCVSDVTQKVTLPTSQWVHITHLAGNRVLNPRDARHLAIVIRQSCGIAPRIYGESCIDKAATQPGTTYRFRPTRGCRLSDADLDVVRRVVLILDLGAVVITVEKSHVA